LPASAAVGSFVEIHGANFIGSPSPTVTFDGLDAGGVIVEADDSISVRVPAGLPSGHACRVEVRTSHGAFTSVDGFTVA